MIQELYCREAPDSLRALQENVLSKEALVALDAIYITLGGTYVAAFVYFHWQKKNEKCIKCL